MKKFEIDLNADIGEGAEFDAEIMHCITSANISCGVHAGDANTIRRAVRSALQNEVAIGAHPGYDDRENFGRKEQNLPPEEIKELILEQLIFLDKIVQEEGGKIRHVKPHGALYNQAAVEPLVAEAVIQGIKEFDSNLYIMGLAGSLFLKRASQHGMKTIAEAFADRRYNTDGTLVSRSIPGAVIEDPSDAAAQALAFAEKRNITAINGTPIFIDAQSICLHGDNQHALEQAQFISRALRGNEK